MVIPDAALKAMIDGAEEEFAPSVETWLGVIEFLLGTGNERDLRLAELIADRIISLGPHWLH